MYSSPVKDVLNQPRDLSGKVLSWVRSISTVECKSAYRSSCGRLVSSCRPQDDHAARLPSILEEHGRPVASHEESVFLALTNSREFPRERYARNRASVCRTDARNVWVGNRRI